MGYSLLRRGIWADLFYPTFRSFPEASITDSNCYSVNLLRNPQTFGEWCSTKSERVGVGYQLETSLL